MDVFRVEIGKLRFFACRIVRRHFDGLSPQRFQHSVQDIQISFSSGIDDAGLFQHGIQIDGVRQGLLPGFQRPDQDRLQIARRPGAFHRRGRGQPGYREDRSLRRLHDGLVSGLDAGSHGRSQHGGIGGFLLLEGFCHAAEQQGQNDAGVSSRAAEKASGSRIGRLGQGDRLFPAALGSAVRHRQTHVRSGVPVGDRKNIEFVDLILVQLDGRRAVCHHFRKERACQYFCHLSPPQPAMMEST